jgi:glycerol 2-dehydrogenase (NADP+)
MGKTWAQMEEILASGKVKAIGVCNWSIPYLESLKKTWRIKPMVNQVELHPYLPQHDLVQWCKKEGILIEAYSPLGGSGETFWPLWCSSHFNNGVFITLFSHCDLVLHSKQLSKFGTGAPIVSDSELATIAKKHNVLPANILISYHVSQGVIPLVKSTSTSRLKSNLKVVNLDDHDLETLKGLSNQPGKAKRYNTPLWGWDLGFSDWESKD